ncbi:methyltransferase [Halomonas sp. A020]|uniref:class I SAM-dependent methyltransferase n=1 Tax=Halomonas sp. A020 TaxID=2717374 RepID=UPI00248FC6A1|nr:class I SAM-dependent methyltransferase [Halomonas sp. A020]BCB59935.1 methyltransferase [Halomonas sp. A020]
MTWFSENTGFSCLLCHYHDYQLHFQNVRGDESGNLKIVNCAACGHRQLSLPVYNLSHYEKDMQVYSSIEECGTPLKKFIENSWLEAQRRVNRVLTDRLMPQSQQFMPACLDIGGGYGFFSHLLKSALPGAQVDMLDPSEARIETGKKLIEERDEVPTQIRYIAGLLDNIFAHNHQSTYDLITLWHVVEHVPEPIQLVKDAWQLVKPGGWLSIEVPNANDELLSLSSAFANYSYMIEHLSYFSPDKLSELIELGTDRKPDNLYGYQRYGIFNYMHWIYANAPLGAEPDFFPGEDRWWLEKTWREQRADALTTDALVVNIQKPERG